jgi:toxin ParE1/3/4
MAYRVELSRRAELDLLRIFAFIHASESQGAARWFCGLESQIQSLADLPNRGTVADYDQDLRFVLYGNKPHIYRILYRIDEESESVAVRHIRHGARKALSRAAEKSL